MTLRRSIVAGRTALPIGLPSVSALVLGVAAGFAFVVGPLKAAELAGRFDGVYVGTVAVTSVRAVPCDTADLAQSITIADGVASLVYLPDAAGKSIVLKALVSKGGIFSGEGKGAVAVNMAGTVKRDLIVARAWAWNCEYALTMQKGDKAALDTASAPK